MITRVFQRVASKKQAFQRLMTNLRLLKVILLPSSATELQPKQGVHRTDISSNSSTENELLAI